MYYYAKWQHKVPHPDQKLFTVHTYTTYDFFDSQDALQKFYDRCKKLCTPNKFIESVGVATSKSGHIEPDETTQQLTNLDPFRE